MSSQSAPAEEPPVSRHSSIAASAGVGVFAAVIGYLLTYLLVASEVREAVSDTVAEWKVVAWFFYEAHMVDVEISGRIGSFAGMSTLDLIAQSDAASATLLYVVPPLVLLAAGAVLAVRWNVADLGEAVVAGARPRRRLVPAGLCDCRSGDRRCRRHAIGWTRRKRL